MKNKELELYLDFCEECFQMTNHLNGECQKCRTKETNKSQYDSDFDDEETDYRIKK